MEKKLGEAQVTWVLLNETDKTIITGVSIGTVITMVLGGSIIQAGAIYGLVMLATIVIILSYFPEAQEFLAQHISWIDLSFTVLLLVVGVYGGVIRAVGYMFLGFLTSVYLRFLRAKNVEVSNGKILGVDSNPQGVCTEGN